jgi:hypothetical protein
LQRRPIPGFDSIQISWGGGFSTYHALQTKFEKRYSAGVYLLNSFTWSKAIDNASGHLEAFNGDNSRVNFRNLPSEKAVGAYDQPFNNTTSVVWELPYGRGRHWGANTHPVINGILGGWRLSGINTMTSGQPINFSYSPLTQNQATTNVSPTYRPNYQGGSIYSASKDPAMYLNKAAFGIPTAQELFGNMGRNVGRTESIYNFDLGLHKEFPIIGENMRLQFRSEFFNLFNTTNLGAPAQNVSNSNFGVITSLSSPARQIQFALKLVF